MCGVEMTGSKSKRTDELCAVKPLEDDAAFKIIDGKEVWHPLWKGNIDDKVNALFVKNVVQRIWQNEQVSASLSMCGQDEYLHFELQRRRDGPGGKGEIADANFTMPVITSCVKNYWRNVHKQWCQRMDPERRKKSMETTKHRARCSTVGLLAVLCSSEVMLITRQKL